MTSPRAVLDQILEAISPASEAQAAGARARVAQARGPRDSLGAVEQLAVRLAAARHAPSPSAARKLVVVCAADHGVADPGVDLGPNNPTLVALRHIADGEAAINAAARTAGAGIVLVDCGVRGGDRHPTGTGVLDVRLTDGSGDIRTGAAMTPATAVQALQTGIALVISLAEDGVDVIALGQVSAGSQTVSGALIAAFCDNADEFGDEDRDAIGEAIAAAVADPGSPLDLLATTGGPDIGVMTGVILGAAALNIPVVLDDHATWAAALLATGLAPAAAGYLIASHAGTSPAHRRALSRLGLEPLFDLGLSHGEGTGAALALPFVDAATQLLSDSK